MTDARRDARAVWFCAILSIVIVVPRSILISRAHSPCLDDDLHLDQGLAYLRGESHPHAFYDPPLGKVILALPLHFAGCRVHHTQVEACVGPARDRRTVLYDQPHDVQTLQTLLAVWKSLLFVPCVIVAFVWTRRLYGPSAAWLAMTLLLVEPNIAAHIPVAALDVFAMEAVIIASYLTWRYVAEPTRMRLVTACLATAAAMLVKHTAILLPAAFVALAIVQWFVRPWIERSMNAAALRASIRPRLNALAVAVVFTLIAMWMLSLFDFSSPASQRALGRVSYTNQFSLRANVVGPAMQARWPAGVYLGSLFAASEKTEGGHFGYLWGEIREHGWIYYFPAAALYKVPVGVWLIGALAIVSLFLRRIAWEDLSLILPANACAAVLVTTGYNVGFRHALPTYALILLFASRCAATGHRGMNIVAWIGVGLSVIHSLSYHPDYLSYTNGISKRPHLAISDSNVDWDQGFKQIGRWIDAHPQPGRAVWIDVFGDIGAPAIDRYIGARARRLCDADPTPCEGLLIVSPARLVGLFAMHDRWRHLRDREPDDVIGHSLLVYDLDDIAGESISAATPPDDFATKIE